METLGKSGNNFQTMFCEISKILYYDNYLLYICDDMNRDDNS